MLRFLFTTMLLLTPIAVNASDLGVSITIGQPGFYGQITLGNHYPSPRLIYPDPIIAMPRVGIAQPQPIYLYVPPGHAKKWSKHCHRYHACHLPVYFVQEDWYDNVYVPQYRQHNLQPDDHHRDTHRRMIDSDYQRMPDDKAHRHSRHPGRDRFGDDHEDRTEHGKGRRDDRDDHGKNGKKDFERGNRKEKD